MIFIQAPLGFHYNICKSIGVCTSKDPEYISSIPKHLDSQFFSIFIVMIFQNLSPVTTHFYNSNDHANKCNCFQKHSILNHANLYTNLDHNQTYMYFLYSCYYFVSGHASNCNFQEDFKASSQLIYSQHKHLYLYIFWYSIFPLLFSQSFKYSTNIFSLLLQSHDQQHHPQLKFTQCSQFLFLFYRRATKINDELLTNSNFFLLMQNHQLCSSLKVFIFQLSFLTIHLFRGHHLIQSMTSLIILSLYFFS